MKLTDGRWRKATSVENKYASFELLIGDSSPLLAVFFSDDGVFCIAFGKKIAGTFSWNKLVEIVQAGRELAEQDMSI